MHRIGVFIIIVSAIFVGLVAVRFRGAPEPEVPPDAEQVVREEETSDVLEERGTDLEASRRD